MNTAFHTAPVPLALQHYFARTGCVCATFTLRSFPSAIIATFEGAKVRVSFGLRLLRLLCRLFTFTFSIGVSHRFAFTAARCCSRLSLHLARRTPFCYVLRACLVCIIARTLSFLVYLRSVAHAVVCTFAWWNTHALPAEGDGEEERSAAERAFAFLH